MPTVNTSNTLSMAVASDSKAIMMHSRMISMLFFLSDLMN